MARKPGTRSTRQRRVVYDTVCSATCHPTADWIFEQVRETLPNISLGTVYRNLSVLRDEGLIREIWGDDRRAHYEEACEPHAHFVCSTCSTIRDVHGAPRFEWRTMKDLVGCDVEEQRIEFVGTCPTCRARPPRQA